jgi:hypothetical protein
LVNLVTGIVCISYFLFFIKDNKNVGERIQFFESLLLSLENGIAVSCFFSNEEYFRNLFGYDREDNPKGFVEMTIKI